MDINTLWFFLIGIAFCMYMTLDGFDFGIGMLLPFLPKEGPAKRDALSSMWPVWDGNELWGLIAAGSSFAVFPAVFAGALPLLYPFVFILMACLILRPVAFEMWFRQAAPASRAVWERVFTVGGFLAAFLVGDLFGLFIGGLPLSGTDPYGGSLAAAFGLLPLVSGLCFVAFSLSQGALYLGLKTEREARAVAGRSLAYLWPLSALLTGLFLALVAFGRKSGGSAGFLVGTILSAIGLAGIAVFRARRERLAFAASFLQAAGVFIAAGSSQYPVLVADSANPAASLTIYSAAASGYSLRLLGTIACVGLGLVAVYSLFVYAIFKGKVRPADFYHDLNPEADMTQKKSMVGNLIGKLAGDKKLVRCKICGYIMPEDALKDVCPACGVSAKVFETYVDPVERDRAFILKLDIHPIIVHAPQALTLIMLVLALAAIIVPGWKPDILTSIGVLAWILPFSLLAAFGSGLFDGKIRFKKTSTRLLRRKMLLAGIFFASSLGMLYFADSAGLGTGPGLLLFLACNLVGFAMSAFLGLIGASLVHAVFVKLGPKKPAARE